MDGVRDEVSIIYAAQWPLFPQTLGTQFRVRRLFSGRSKSSAQGLSITQRYACLGADIARDSSRRNRERGVGPGEGGWATGTAQWCTTGLDQRASKHAMPRENKVFCRCSLGDGWTTASRTRLLVLQVYFWTKNAADRQARAGPGPPVY